MLRSEWRKRLVATSAATWTEAQFVHEALPSHLRTERVQADIEHEFLPSFSGRAARNDTYGLLWALQEQARRRGRGEAAELQALAAAGDCGALFREVARFQGEQPRHLPLTGTG